MGFYDAFNFCHNINFKHLKFQRKTTINGTKKHIYIESVGRFWLLLWDWFVVWFFVFVCLCVVVAHLFELMPNEFALYATECNVHNIHMCTTYRSVIQLRFVNAPIHMSFWHVYTSLYTCTHTYTHARIALVKLSIRFLNFYWEKFAPTLEINLDLFSHL